MADPVYGNTTPSVNRVGTYMPVTTTASISEPAPQVPRPTAVSSSLLASNTVNDTIKPALDQSLNDIAAHNDATSPYFDSGDVNNFASSYKKSQAAAKPAKTDASSTAEDTLANSPDAGNRFIYSNTDGTRTQIPVNQPIPVGYGTSMNPVLAKTPENDSFFGSNGNKYVAYSDGNYARLDENGNYVGDITSNEFNQAKAGSAQGHMESIQRDIDSIRNGSYPLNAIQQAQINGLLSQSGEAVRQQEEANANLTGGVTTAQNLYGMGNSIAGIGAIAASIKAGTTAILSLQAQTAQAVAKMQAAFQADNMKEALDAYNVYKSSKDSMQAKFDDMHKEVVAENDKIKAANDATDARIQSAILDAKKGGASSDQIAAMSEALKNHNYAGAVDAAGSSLETASGTLGEYIQYKKDTAAKGLVPLDFTAWHDNENFKAEQAKARAQSAQNATDSDKVQQKLEQEGRQVVKTELSSKTGTLGIEDNKVAQANHLNSLFIQYYDPKTGDYNIPTSQYKELSLGLANLLTAGNKATKSDIEGIEAATAKGDFNKAIQYLGGTPQNGSTQAIIKNLIDSVDRQAAQAVKNRGYQLDKIKALLPTDLEQSRKDALTKAADLVIPYGGQERVDKAFVDTVNKEHGDAILPSGLTLNETIAQAYEKGGMIHGAVAAWLEAQGYTNDSFGGDEGSDVPGSPDFKGWQ